MIENFWPLQNSSSTDTTVAEFFGSLSVATRHFFDDDDKTDRTSSSEKNWQPTATSASIDGDGDGGDADVSFRTKYSTLPSKKFSSRSSTSSSRSRLRQPQPQVSSVRLSSFGAEKVCPIVPKDEDLTHAELYVSSNFILVLYQSF